MVRFAVEKGYFVCENELFALPLPAIEKLAYLALTRYAGANNRAWPAYETLGRDISCTRRRAITAVKNLVECRLIEKKLRKNRSNLYLIYPPEYYCNHQRAPAAKEEESGPQAEVNTDHQGVNVLHQGVNLDHRGSEEHSPQGCTAFTTAVNTDHLKSTNKNNMENHPLKNNSAAEESEGCQKECGKDGPELIKAAFKAKGVQVSSKMIAELLSEYEPKAVKAAIQSTDFNLARNPLAVIKWMLATGSYVLPAEKAEPLAVAETRLPDPAEEEAIRQMIREARDGLRKKTLATV